MGTRLNLSLRCVFNQMASAGDLSPNAIDK